MPSKQRFTRFAIGPIGLALVGCGGKPDDPGSSGPRPPLARSQETLLGNCSADMTFAYPSPGVPGDQIALSGISTCQSGTPEYIFWMKPPGGGWAVQCNWQSSATCNWNTTGAAVGKYLFQTWTRAQGSTDPYEGFSYVSSYELMDTCLGNLSPSPISSAVPGEQITLTGASGCHSGPPQDYIFWLRHPNGAWVILCDWQSGTTCNWNTTGMPTGHYELQLWTRDHGTAHSYDGFSYVIPYELIEGSGGTGCKSSTVTAAPASPQFVGTQLTLSATAACTHGSTPQYQFWAKAPGGAWTASCGYGPGSTCQMTPDVTGEWQFKTFVRQTGSTAAYEAVSSVIDFHAAGIGECSSATLTVTPEVFGIVSLTGNGTCSGAADPEFKYWLRDATSGIWSIACDWTVGSCFWDTSELPVGVYQLQVWTRARASSAYYEGFSALGIHTVGNPSCDQIAFIGADPTSPSSAGTTVAFTASSSCLGGGIATYKTWLRPVGGAWSELCDWTTSATCNWVNPAAGDYEIQIWERMLGSTANADSWTSVISHTVTGT